MDEKITTLLLTGPPGVGKTTLVRKICEELQSNVNMKCQGFFTEEIRAGNVRTGFDVITLQGKRGILARENTADGQRRPKIGKYAVYISEFEAIALPLLSVPKSVDTTVLVVIDEIGKMELISKKFEASVNAIAEQLPILATIPYQARQPIATVERLKKSRKSKVFLITKANRNYIQEEIMRSIQEIIKK